MLKLPDGLLPLAEYDQFILWTTVERNGKLLKLPVNYKTAEVDNAHNSEIWMDANTAISTANMFGSAYNIGFVFTGADPFYFVDLDHCLVDGNWTPVATAIMGMLPGAAVEISQSGTGLHIFGKYSDCPEHSCKNITLGLELYTQDRFVALTGTNMVGNCGVDSTVMLPGLINQYFPPKIVGEVSDWTTEGVEGSHPIEDDNELISKAIATTSAASSFGNTASFNNLWTRDVAALSEAYTPDAGDTGEFDESSADAALAQHLAFWTGNNCERIKRLMEQSGVVRDKWTYHKSYIQNTIIRAVSMQTTWYTGGKKRY